MPGPGCMLRGWLLAGLLLAPACGREEPPAGVLVVVVDALRADHLGCYGYARPTSPAIDALARDATLFRTALAPAPWTLPSVATVMTGLYPAVHGAVRMSNMSEFAAAPDAFQAVARLTDRHTTLAQVLSARGVATGAFVRGAYPGRAFGIAQGFERFDDNEEPSVRLNLDALLGWLDAVRPRRFLAYLHTIEVHSPYQPLTDPRYTPDSANPRSRRFGEVLVEERARYGTFDFDPDYEGWLDGSVASLARLAKLPKPVPAREVAHLRALYDRGIRYTDYWLEQLLTALKARGLYDRTLIVVTADHGEELLDHGGVEHSRTYYDEVLRIPLIIRLPGAGHGRVVEQQVGLIDLFPTVLDALGIAADALTLQGRSLLPALRGRKMPPRTFYADAAISPGVAGLRTADWKYVVNRGNGAQQLFDLRGDPAERVNLLPLKEAPRARGFRTEIQARDREMETLASRLGLAVSVPAAVDDATAARLRALGYADGR